MVLALNPSKENHSNFYAKNLGEKVYQFLLIHNYLEHKVVYLVLRPILPTNLLPLNVLQRLQDVTTLSHVVLPPLDLGMT